MRELGIFFSPAKINLFFAVTGMRSDGNHNVFSANIALNFGDEIAISDSSGGRDEIICAAKYLDKNSNTITKALDIFRKNSGIGRHFRVAIVKNIPPESGFGGGSSNGATVLRAVNGICGNVLSKDRLVDLSAKIGADCPFFMGDGPSIASGTGNVCAPMDANLYSALGNYALTIFKPPFGVSTAEAYADLRTKFRHLYVTENEAAQRFESLQKCMVSGDISLPLFNAFSEIFFARHGEMRQLHRDLQMANANAMLTGSGSGCFCLVHKSIGGDSVAGVVRKKLGADVFLKNTTPMEILRE